MFVYIQFAVIFFFFIYFSSDYSSLLLSSTARSLKTSPCSSWTQSPSWSSMSHYRRCRHYRLPLTTLSVWISFRVFANLAVCSISMTTTAIGQLTFCRPELVLAECSFGFPSGLWRLTHCRRCCCRLKMRMSPGWSG